MTRALLAVGAAALAAAVPFVLLIHNPLARGSTGSFGDLTDDSGNHYFRYAPDTDYYMAASIQNDGMLPVTIKGPHQPDEPGASGLYVVEYLVAGGSDIGGMYEVAESDRLVSFDLAPGKELWFWIHWHTRPCDNGHPFLFVGGGATADDVLLDWSILGVPRTSRVPLYVPFDIRNIDEDPHDTCAGSS